MVQLGSQFHPKLQLVFFSFEILLTCFCQNTGLLVIIIYFLIFFLERKKMNLGNNPEMSYDMRAA
jgi:hypothetical protein